MANFYIATRNNWEEMEKLTGETARRLNQKASANVRKAVMDKGIKQSTRAGGRLEFYTVSEEAKNRIIKDASTLAIMAENDLGDLYKNVNANYPRRMDYNTANRYKAELRAKMANIVTVVGADPALEKKKREKHDHGLQVGDWIAIYGDYGYFLGNARVTRVTASSYWYEMALIHGSGFHNFENAKMMFKNVEGSNWGQEWDFTIPYAANEYNFTFAPVEMKRASRYTPSKVEPGYRSERHDRW